MTYEINTNGRDVGLGVGVVGKPQQQAGLSNTRITDKQKLEEIIISGYSCQPNPGNGCLSVAGGFARRS